MSTQHRLKITKNQIKFLYKNILKYQLKGLICKKLGIESHTIDSYLTQGKEYIETYFDYIEDILDIQNSADFIEEEFESLDRQELECEFLNETGYSNIGDKYKSQFDNWLFVKLEKKKEEYIYSEQEKIFDTLKISENEDENRKIILLIKFKLIWDRAHIALSSEYLEPIKRYSKTSKHLSQGMKMLETLNKEDFKKDSDEVQQNNTQNIFTGKVSFVQLSLKAKELGMFGESKEPEKIIDASHLIKDIEDSE